MFVKKKLIIFDMDGTICETKSLMSPEMIRIFSVLLDHFKVAVISGAGIKNFLKQFVGSLILDDRRRKNLFLFPTCSTSFFRYNNGELVNVYSEVLSSKEKGFIMESFHKAFLDIGYVPPKKVFGEVLEDRDSQITMSALGQDAPYKPKQEWDPDNSKRLKIKKALDKYLFDFDVRIGGSTSIDVTKKGIDKSYGIKKIEEYLKISRDDMLFVGDALFDGGNDFPVKKTGVECLEVKGPNDTKKIISFILKSRKYSK